MSEPIEMPPPYDKKATPIERAHLYRILRTLKEVREDLNRLSGCFPPKTRG